MQIIIDRVGTGKIPEWSIIELQGDLQNNETTASFHGKVIGDLHYNLEGEPLLIIGHHVLTGRLAKLEKPLAILKKKPKDDEFEVTEYQVQGMVVQKLLFSERPRPIVDSTEAIFVK
ncbi:chromosome transmission fidelity protein 8 homolog [Neocloeon triangulifer]|uniref:chromosome transmission fidelity protein 8 homolog n=1 Tax=Neocloeon triangulifer TaxID=2078957 RepID=UPI00286F8485|nr:chromosome transmission fidelity protein 8 homolog [Neocloeon triangulifer]